MDSSTGTKKKVRKKAQKLIKSSKLQKKKNPIRNDVLINVLFEYEGHFFSFLSNENEYLSSLFYRFRDKIKDFITDFDYINSAKRLDPKKKLCEVIDNISKFDIKVLKKKDIIGGILSLNFCDLSKQIYEDLCFSEEAPSYRIVCKGINIFGICKYKKCPEAYNKEVVIPLEERKHFNVIKEKEDLQCPVCEAPVHPKTIGFYLCEYIIKGVKVVNENGKCLPFEFKGKVDNEDSLQYFNPDKNGETILSKLIIEITKYL